MCIADRPVIAARSSLLYYNYIQYRACIRGSNAQHVRHCLSQPHIQEEVGHCSHWLSSFTLYLLWSTYMASGVKEAPSCSLAILLKSYYRANVLETSDSATDYRRGKVHHRFS